MKQLMVKRKNLLISLISILSLFIIWELVVTIFKISPTVLVKPSVIFPTCWEKRDVIWREMSYTISEIVPGWFIGNLLGFILAAFIYKSPKLTKSFQNSSVLLNAIPLVALAAILGGIMGTGRDEKILVVSLLCFFPMFIVCTDSFTSLSTEYKELMYSYSSSEWNIFKKILVFKSLHLIVNTLKVSVVTAIFAAVVSEFFGGYGGIGNYILTKKGLYDLKTVWASILYIVVFGTLFYYLIEFIQKKLVFWRN